VPRTEHLVVRTALSIAGSSLLNHASRIGLVGAVPKFRRNIFCNIAEVFAIIVSTWLQCFNQQIRKTLLDFLRRVYFPIFWLMAKAIDPKYNTAIQIKSFQHGFSIRENIIRGRQSREPVIVLILLAHCNTVWHVGNLLPSGSLQFGGENRSEISEATSTVGYLQSPRANGKRCKLSEYSLQIENFAISSIALWKTTRLGTFGNLQRVNKIREHWYVSARNHVVPPQSPHLHRRTHSF